jgi:3-oxoacid CoA-transferase A subunit
LPFKADFALIKAHKADRWGNLVYRYSSRTFNATMAGAAKVTIAEVDKIVELGELKPDEVHTPGIYVDRVVERPTEYIDNDTGPISKEAMESHDRVMKRKSA